MASNDTWVLQNKLGIFIFERDTPISLAKLVRDTITGQFFSPRPGSVRLKNDVDCYNYIRSLDSNVLANVPFGIRILV